MPKRSSSEEKYAPVEETITTRMQPRHIKEIVGRKFDEVPEQKGIM